MFFKVKPIDSFLLSSFYELGMKIGKFPKLHAFISLFISLLITVAPLLSPYELVIERSAPRLWNPTSAQTFKDWKESLKFGGGELYPAFLVVRPAELEGNLLTADLMRQILLVHEDIVSEIGNPSPPGASSRFRGASCGLSCITAPTTPLPMAFVPFFLFAIHAASTLMRLDTARIPMEMWK